MVGTLNGIQALAVLYDLALTIGNEVALDALLAKTLQRFLYHTGLPIGLLLSESLPAAEHGWREARLEKAIGDYGLIKRQGELLRLPAALLAPTAGMIEDAAALAALGTRRPARYLLRLPIERYGCALLVGPNPPASSLPLTEVFVPILSQLARSIDQCRQLAAATEQLQLANRELESFSYSVSHDLRAPLRAIDGFSKILLEDYQEKLDDEGRRYLGIVRNSAVRMGRLIEDILAFSRMGRREMSTAPLDFGEIAHAVFEELRVMEGDRNVRLDVHPMPPAQGDPVMMRQVLQNLIGNALKFTRTRAEAVIEIGGEMRGEENVYFVRDNGVGFDMEYVGKLFGVFERLHPNEQFEGTGIGLAIVKRIVNRHNGRVWAEGKVDAGATFWFALSRRGWTESTPENPATP